MVTNVAICQLQVDKDESGRSRAPRRVESLLKLLVRICNHPSVISLPCHPSILCSLPPTPPPSISLPTSPPGFHPHPGFFTPTFHPLLPTSYPSSLHLSLSCPRLFPSPTQHLSPPLHSRSLFSQLFDNPPGGLPAFFLSLFIPQAVQ